MSEPAAERLRPPRAGSERESLEAFLDVQRQIVVAKATGLSDADGAQRLVASLTTVSGLVRHLADVERGWFREDLDGEKDVPSRYTPDDPDGEFRVTADDSLAGILVEYGLACSESRAVAARYQLDDLCGDGDGHSLRWIYLHMIEETARHAGHIDILRELLDGVTGD
jgi:uncharacterized damage-inducible protein DinB